MQALDAGRRLGGETKDAVLGVLADRYCRAILECTMYRPRSAAEICSESGVPISTVYRRLQALHEAKLIGITGTISDDGKKYLLYRSKMRSAACTFNGGCVEIQVVPNKPWQPAGNHA
ncbi:transcriptional regulator [Cenarchaeum symbiosum A]|uniref:Transcriptional regulator n=1 Tax=Cenarchaeum symbiosum (strain A) TaxID=414004 RepID=A0RYL6_CENSY|nr:transcriptional regulator [Cenarchaeum symbiosum A]